MPPSQITLRQFLELVLRKLGSPNDAKSQFWETSYFAPVHLHLSLTPFFFAGVFFFGNGRYFVFCGIHCFSCFLLTVLLKKKEVYSVMKCSTRFAFSVDTWEYTVLEWLFAKKCFAVHVTYFCDTLQIIATRGLKCGQLLFILSYARADSCPAIF